MTDEEAASIPFRTLLYRYMFFGWLFRDVNLTRDVFERHAALQHNKSMSRFLPTYLRRWTFLATFDFGIGCLLERTLQATMLSATFFTGTCVLLAGSAVIAAAWAILAHARLS
ncbi:MAG: hypothetical protein V4463_13220 [Pseudomonadota bacterium]